MARNKDAIWTLPDNATFESAQISVLMDIRDELKQLNSVLGCYNFKDVPNILRGIRKKIPIKRRKKI